ncbi:MAG: dihydropteroate synthase [Sediminibacterium sp. Gen4]|jgi:dihydropteroate synthase|uniref:dihydropteroate synthase n=2 Tax=unclassified Sediminibacterium TaxID=2635961 RepID=UPI0015BA6CD3|nr:dihydropteroate synthase [Sediminibacterium sp. Gen4]MBW0161087.1 dihydropteroate synthase [Sediminibacterium sp.]MBW0165220.1 dihydropteroate synthase [Sediminibacterium sp.]NWK66891.1 dihydropteroate synthase [Sediminibacterium sp. Gen4]
MFTLNCKGRLLTIDQPIVMGIINTTPDSFYEDSRKSSLDAALSQAEKMIREGATILDIGAQSTRPGSTAVGPEEEIQRLAAVIPAIHHRFPDTILSVDTYYSAVAIAAAEMGASIVNDISGGQFDTAMIATAANLHMPFVCMHVEGKNDTMHQTRVEGNVTISVTDYFIKRIGICKEQGLTDLILDPGFGFSKTTDQNFELIRSVSQFKLLGKPVLMGVSRKSTIYKTLNCTAAEALNGTTVLHTAVLLGGADILRVHDVKEAMEAITLTRYLL